MDKNWSVFVLLADGRIRAVTPPDGRYTLPCIHPDGDRLVCQGGQPGEKLGIWQFDITSGERFALSPPDANAWAPAYSWDGRHVAFSSDYGGEVRFDSIDEMPVWLTPHDPVPMAIYVVDTDGGNLQRITTGEHQDIRPSFHPDGGKQVVFVSNRGGSLKLWLVDAAGASAPELLPGSYAWAMRPWFAPDGESIFFHTEIDGSHRICRYWLASGRWEPLPHDTGDMSRGAFVVPGEDTLLIHTLRDGQMGIWRLSLDGSRAEPVVLPGFTIAGHATQATDGTIAFDSPERGNSIDT